MIFTERLEQKEWWSGQASLLNLSDINLPPDYYNGSEWDWIREITAYIFREPETWQDIYKEYLVKAQQQANTEHTRLNYYRDEEGYIRRELARRVNLRNTPEISFILDQSIEHGVHMSHLIDEVTKDLKD